MTNRKPANIILYDRGGDNGYFILVQRTKEPVSIVPDQLNKRILMVVKNQVTSTVNRELWVRVPLFQFQDWDVVQSAEH